MKKAFKSVIFWIALCAILLLLFGCKSQQQHLSELSSKDVTVKETTNIDRSKEILDSLKWYLGDVKTAKPECDSITKDFLQRVLSMLNTHKQSGDNSWGLYYDKFENLLVAYAKIGETMNKEKVRDSIIIRETVREVPVPQPEPTFDKWAKRSGIALWVLLVAAAAIKIYSTIKK